MIKTKLVNIFATKFSPDLEADTLKEYLKEKIDGEVTCWKIEAAQTRFSSFHISAKCTDVAEMYDPVATLSQEGPEIYQLAERMQGVNPSARIDK